MDVACDHPGLSPDGECIECGERCTHVAYQAVEAVRAVYKSAAIGHDGDIPGGGERTLCWVDEATSVDDDGARACCSIVRSHP